MDNDEDTASSGRNLGIAYTDGSGYLTGNDDNTPDSPAALRPPEDPEANDFDERGQPRANEGEPGAGDSRVGLGGVLGTDIVDPSARRSETFNAVDLERIGTDDMKTQEAVYHQYTEGHQED